MTNGFTLIELVIVMISLGILSSIALPTYQTYIICSKIIEVLMGATIFKIAVTEASQLGLAHLLTTCKEFSCGTLGGGESHLVAILSTVMNAEILIEEQTIQEFRSASLYWANSYSDAMMQVLSQAQDFVIFIYKVVSRWKCQTKADGTGIPLKYLPMSCQ